MLFKRNKKEIEISEIKLKKDYAFMYENFIVSSQQTLYLFLENKEEKIEALKFDFLVYKYGYPNDEVAHPLSKFGLGFYGFYKVDFSPWINEIIDINKQHEKHSENHFKIYEHFIIKFKDVTLEVISQKYEEVTLTKTEIENIITQQTKFL